MKHSKLHPRHQKMLALLAEGRSVLASTLIQLHHASASSVTLKRDLAALVKARLLVRTGKGRATRYQLSSYGQLFVPIDGEAYFQRPPEKRSAKTRFNFELLDLLETTKILTADELSELSALQSRYLKNRDRLTAGLLKREFERVTIELSWKSAAIEGNTYSLLETETLLKEGIPAKGKKAAEARMLLNHKEALDFIRSDTGLFEKLSLAKIEQIHCILTRGLGVTRNIRKTSVGITGSDYRPIDNPFQIREAIEGSCALMNAATDCFTKSLLALLLISYVQPFEDGNKRTARLIANAILLAADAFPLSFRSVDETEYKKAILLFYEQNSIVAFKDLFIEQARFSVGNYFKP